MNDEERKNTFLKNLNEHGVRECPDIALLRVRRDGNVVALIPNIPGKQGSLKVYRHVADNPTPDCVTIYQTGIKKALDIFGPYVVEALSHLGKHPNIDFLIDASYKIGIKLEVETVNGTSGLLEALTAGTATSAQRREAVALLDAGKIRCAEKIFNIGTGEGAWQPQLYAIDAMNAAFKDDTFGYEIVEGGIRAAKFWDKVPLKTRNWEEEDFRKAGVRFIPGSFVRMGAYVGPGTTVMPGGIVNTGAYVSGDGVMVDGGARVGTGAQVGKGVKIGGGSGLEGILEPRGRLPTIVEDNVKIGAMSEVSGIVEEGAIIASGVVMAPGKKVIDLRDGKEIPPLVITVGDKQYALPRIPKGRLALSGTYARGDHGLACVLLHEKDAREVNFSDPNLDLYSKPK